MRVRRVPPIGAKIYACAVCGVEYEEGELRSQNGGKVCAVCYDQPRRGPRTRKRNRI